MTSHDREAAHASVLHYTRTFETPLIPTSELRDRLNRREDVILVDVRTADEQRVSMIPGAVSQETFESDVLPSLVQQAMQHEESCSGSPLIVPYCTVGYRSGLYCHELTQAHKLRNVRNGEGVIMWSFDAGPLVRPEADGRAPKLRNNDDVTCLGNAHSEECDKLTSEVQLHRDHDPEAIPVREIHVYGRAWDYAAEGFTTVYYSNAEGAWRFVRSNCGRAYNERVWLWIFALALWYFLFTPACGYMFKCGCSMWVTKWGQVQHCNIYDDDTHHKCPWCTCSGLTCILVAFDTKAFRHVPVLDLCPDGTFVTILTVVAMYFAWKQLDGSLGEVCGRRFLSKAAAALVWFCFYTIFMGLAFFLTSPDYPFFLAYVRNP